MATARMPRYLHLPVQLLWFYPEEVIAFTVGYFFWLIIDHWSLAVIGLAVPYAMIRIRKSKPRGFVRHWMRKFGFVHLKGYPSPLTREWAE